MNTSAARKIQKKRTSTILRRIAERDVTAVKDCIEAYGSLVWALARKFTHSSEEAARATEEVFKDIWRYGGHNGGGDIQSAEEKLIARIALRRLIKLLSRAEQNHMSDVGAIHKQGT